MTPKPTKGVPVELDKVRHFRFPLSVLRSIQGDGDSSLENLLYLGLKHEDPDLTPEAVADMVSLDMLEQLKEPLKKATGGLIDLDALFVVAGNLSAEAAEQGAKVTQVAQVAGKKGAQAPTPEQPERAESVEGAETGS